MSAAVVREEEAADSRAEELARAEEKRLDLLQAVLQIQIHTDPHLKRLPGSA